MKSNLKIFKHIFFAFILVLLLLPALQSRFEFVKTGPLYGGFSVKNKPSFDSLSSETWFNEKFQEKFDTAVEENIGFRNFFIRLNNQVNYSIYHVSENPNLVIGKNDCLFEEGYILGYLGRNFIGKDLIKQRMKRAKWVQDYFKKEKNIDILFVFAPSKGSYHSQYIPSRYRPYDKQLSNYDWFLQCCRDLGIRHIDFQHYFLDMKDTSRYPLYPIYGVHWSTYGMELAADSIVHYIEGVRNIDMPDFDRSHIVVTDQNKDVDVDWDAEQALNLLFRLPASKMAYPQLVFNTDTAGKTRPRVLTVADSYYWSMFNSGIPQHCFKDHQFWYYYLTIYPWIWDNSHMVCTLNVKQEIEKQDVIIMMSTEMNLYRAWWNFIDDLYRWYNPAFREDNFYNAQNEIINKDMWLRKHIAIAKKEGVTVEEAVKKDAVRMCIEKN